MGGESRGRVVADEGIRKGDRTRNLALLEKGRLEEYLIYIISLQCEMLRDSDPLLRVQESSKIRFSYKFPMVFDDFTC